MLNCANEALTAYTQTHTRRRMVPLLFKGMATWPASIDRVELSEAVVAAKGVAAAAPTQCGELPCYR